MAETLDLAAMLAELRRLLPAEPGQLEASVREDTSALRQPDRSLRTPIAVQSAALERVPAERQRLAGQLERGLQLLRSEIPCHQLMAALPLEDQQALASLYLVYGRPAIPIRQNQFGPRVAGWELLENWRDAIQSMLPAVGRIEQRTPSGGYKILGTGFLVASNAVMTAAHVATKLDLGDAGGHLVWNRIDWRGEADSPESFARFPLVRSLWRPFDRDVAILQIDIVQGDPPDSLTAEPLPLARVRPDSLEEAIVVSIGYPLATGESDVLEQVFPGEMGTKRLKPGKMLSPAFRGRFLRHDCSTLQGSSGAPLLLLTSENPVVIGLHIAGTSFVENLAEPSWDIINALRLEPVENSHLHDVCLALLGG